ncbi:MAG: MFS transporter [Candidatus Berkiellales bacterium]
MSGERFFPWLMWLFPLLFFGFQFILRLFPGLVMSEFLQKYQISATDFGVFASLYYIGYACMQIPVAMLLDKYGPRKVISTCALLCGAATCLFVLLTSWPIALLSRFLIGVGSVVGFLGVSKVISQWFPAKSYSKMIGLSFSFGLLGALYGGRPVSLMIEQMGWEKVSLILGAAAMVLGLFAFLFVRDKAQRQERTPPLTYSLKKLLSQRSLIILAVANFLMVGSLEGFADVWGVSYLMTARDLTRVEAASITSFIFVGMLFGGPLLAFLSEKFKAHFFVTMMCGVLMATLLLCLLYFNEWLPEYVVIAMMFCIGILCCYQVIVFTIGADVVPAYLMSIGIAFLNCINMLGGSFFHTFIGRLMDYFEPNAVTDQVKSYSLEAYTYTLLLIPLASLLGAGLVWWSRHVYQQQVKDEVGREMVVTV